MSKFETVDDIILNTAGALATAMRLDRENETPPFRNGNSHAETRARVVAAKVAAAIRGGDAR